MSDTSSPKPEILYVDDEAHFAGRYIEALGHLFVVHFVDNAEAALHLLKNNSNIKAIVLDIMMPTPEGVLPRDTNSGLDTGLWMLHRIKEIQQPWRSAILILTNRDMEYVQTQVARLEIPERLVLIRWKVDTPAFIVGPQLSAHIVNVLGGFGK